MKKAILATKVGMTQIFNEDGVLTPVTVLQAGPCVVTQIKTVENDGRSGAGMNRAAVLLIAIILLISTAVGSTAAFLITKTGPQM